VFQDPNEPKKDPKNLQIMATANITECLTTSIDNCVISLSCAGCYAVPSVNQIYQCENGHTICIECYEVEQLEGAIHCTKCKTKMFKTRYTDFVTNYILPRLSIPCPFFGCSGKTLWAEMETHKRDCEHGKRQREIELKAAEELERKKQQEGEDFFAEFVDGLEELEDTEQQMQEINIVSPASSPLSTLQEMERLQSL